MTAISLLTDFGLADPYVGIMKGVILSVNSAARVIDITHDVPPQDLLEAAYLIQSAYSYFPLGTVHVVVVDPGVGGDRPIVCIELNGYRFLAPDNGVLSQIFTEGEIERAVYVENADYLLKSISHTFHGRDIFAPVAAHLSIGLDIGALGAEASSADLVRLQIPQPEFLNESSLVGTIISIDRFGNLVTDIRQQHLIELLEKSKKEKIEIQIRAQRIFEISKSYDAVEPQQPLAIMGSRGLLEIAVNCGNAKDIMGVRRRDQVKVSLK
jgi:S-adenosyl-L-methionine hydrolase (adenosine-forming)